MNLLRKYALCALGASAVALSSAAALAADAATTCRVVGKDVPAVKDQKCPGDVLATLRSYSYEYQVAKLDQNGARVLDEKTGQPVMETRRETFALMADMLEAGGLREPIGKGVVTVFAVPDSVLGKRAADWRAALQDKDRKAEAVAAIASHVVDEPLRRGWFASGNGRIWTLAGSFGSGAKGVEFHDLSEGMPLRVNGAKVGNADIEASNGIVHVVSGPLADVRKSEKVAAAQ